MNPEIFPKNQTNGVRSIDSSSIGLATMSDIFSEFWDAYVFGVISPNIKIRNVITPVAIPTPADPSKFVKTIVARDAAPMLTRLFPIRIVMINFCGFCFILKSVSAPFFPCFRSDLTFI